MIHLATGYKFTLHAYNDRSLLLSPCRSYLRRPCATFIETDYWRGWLKRGDIIRSKGGILHTISGFGEPHPRSTLLGPSLVLHTSDYLWDIRKISPEKIVLYIDYLFWVRKSLYIRRIERQSWFRVGDYITDQNWTQYRVMSGPAEGNPIYTYNARAKCLYLYARPIEKEDITWTS